MRFKTALAKRSKHAELVSGVAWVTTDDLLSCGDDHKLLKWNLVNNETTRVVDFPQDLFPTGLQILPRAAGTNKGGDLCLMTGAEGKFYLLSIGGKIERAVDAHRGAVLCGRWSHDGAGIVTGGEDGLVKIWSRSGMLRSTLAQGMNPSYGVAWSPNSDAILYTSGKFLVVKPLQPNSKPVQWRGHDGLVLCVDWSALNNLILSGGEDTRYRLWDNFGRMLFNSAAHDYPITSVSWAPDGEMFAVGSFNTLRLCDKAGWSHCLEKPNTGSVLTLAWSGDGTQVAGGCGNGHVIFAHVIERRLEWRSYEATLTGRKTIALRNVQNETWEKLELNDRIIQVSLANDHLVVVTANQCFIYSTKNWNTPVIFALREGNVRLIVQAEKIFLLADGAGVYIYAYDGKLVSSPKWPGMRPDLLNSKTISLANDTIAVREKNDEKSVMFFEAATGKPLNEQKSFSHTSEVMELALNQGGNVSDRRCAFVDRNRDLFLCFTRKEPPNNFRVAKLGNMMQSVCWKDNTNMLAALHNGKLTIYYYPNALYVDKDLLPKTQHDRQVGEFGKNPHLVSFVGEQVVVRRSDGALVHALVPPYPSILHEYAVAGKWDEAVRLCRFVKDENLWACLAAMATNAKDLTTAEVAYAAIDEADKVSYIKYIKDIPLREVRAAEMALLAGNVKDAEGILLQNGLVFRAIMMHLQLFHWEKALDLAVKHKTHLDTVLAYRKRYLERFERDETNKKFVQFSENVKLDWDAIRNKVQMEFQRELERTRGGGGGPQVGPGGLKTSVGGGGGGGAGSGGLAVSAPGQSPRKPPGGAGGGGIKKPPPGRKPPPKPEEPPPPDVDVEPQIPVDDEPEELEEMFD